VLHLESNVLELRPLVKLLHRKHYICDDGWYSCPASGDCCNEDRLGDDGFGKCNCGVDEYNAQVDKALALLARCV